jgi:hypothetical protein
VDPRAGLDDVEKRKFLTLPGLELRPSVFQPVATRYTDYAIPAQLHDSCFSHLELLNRNCSLHGLLVYRVRYS